jgi:hypothetical protein
VIQAPSEKFPVTCREKESRAGKTFSRADQRLKVTIRFADGMSEESNTGRVSGDPAVVFNDLGGPKLDRARDLVMS